MIWTKALQEAASAIAEEAGKPWYAEHVERRLKERAFDLSGYTPGQAIKEPLTSEIQALRNWLDPYRARPSHAAFKKAWAEATALQPALAARRRAMPSAM